MDEISKKVSDILKKVKAVDERKNSERNDRNKAE
jgi:hypothetical protein